VAKNLAREARGADATRVPIEVILAAVLVVIALVRAKSISVSALRIGWRRLVVGIFAARGKKVLSRRLGYEVQ
jgi:hypothetical protein